MSDISEPRARRASRKVTNYAEIGTTTVRVSDTVVAALEASGAIAGSEGARGLALIEIVDLLHERERSGATAVRKVTTELQTLRQPLLKVLSQELEPWSPLTCFYSL